MAALRISIGKDNIYDKTNIFDHVRGTFFQHNSDTYQGEYMGCTKTSKILDPLDELVKEFYVYCEVSKLIIYGT